MTNATTAKSVTSVTPGAHVAVVQAIYEAFGRVIAESMACEVPVVAENRGGYTQFVRDGMNGFLFDTNDEAFEKIIRLRDDKGFSQAIGEAARQSIVELYSSEARAEMVEFYFR